jgi:VWFA-related protein
MLLACAAFLSAQSTPSSETSSQTPAPAAGPSAAQPQIQVVPSDTPEFSQQEDTQSFKVKVNLVEIRVVVRDKNGNAVGDLKQDDFIVLDDKKPQTISKFSVERAEVAQRPTTQSQTAAPSSEIRSHLAPERFFAYVFDDLNLEAVTLSTARSAAISRLDLMQYGERWAIYTTSGRVQVDFTDDRTKLRDALGRIIGDAKPPSTGYDCPYISYYQADLITNKHNSDAFEAAVRDYIACYSIPSDSSAQAAAAIAAATPTVTSLSQQVLERGDRQTKLVFQGLDDVVRKLAVMPGERTMVVISPGFLVLEDHRAESAVIERALSARVAISTLDARGLYARDPAGDITRKSSVSAGSLVYENQLAAESRSSQSQVLAELADGTGGRFVQNTNDFAGALGRLGSSPEYTYLLAFAPQGLRSDGSFHNLKIELKQNSGYTIQARKGYYAPSGDADSQSKREVAEAVFGQGEIHELPVRAQTQFFRSADDKAHVNVVVHVDVRQMQFKKTEGRNLNELVVVAALFDRNANLVNAKSNTVKMHIKDDTLATKLNSGITLRSSFDVPPGSYLVRVVARDEQGKMATQNDVVEIP